MLLALNSRQPTGSLVLLFEKELGFSNAQADTQFALWSGVCYVMPLFGGWVADRFLGEWNFAGEGRPGGDMRTYVNIEEVCSGCTAGRHTAAIVRAAAVEICRVCREVSTVRCRSLSFRLFVPQLV